MMRVALVSREFAPFGGGGIGEYVSACAHVLADVADVTIFTTSAHAASSRSGDGDVSLPPNVDVVFVPETGDRDRGGFLTAMHAYSAHILDTLREHYGSQGPDLVEFSDYLGEGAVTAQARRNGLPFLAATRVVIRLHSSAEICSILDGHLGDDLETRVLFELERMALRDADWLLWPGGDTCGFYQRFYGGELPLTRRVRNPYLRQRDTESEELPKDRDEPTRFLYLGRIERRKGVQNLLRAAISIGDPRFELTLLGGDTPTGPLGTSLKAQLELMAAGDPRIDFADPVPLSDLEKVIRRHDAVVLPSLWECWPYVGLEAMRMDRPLIASPTGGFLEMVRPGVSGWLTADVGVDSLRERLVELFLDPEALERPRLERLPSATFAELTDPEPIRAAYLELADGPGRWGGQPTPRPRSAERGDRVAAPLPPLVTAIVPYFHMQDYIEETVESLFAQTHPRMEVLIVNDGSFSASDRVLAELATRYPIGVVTQTNHGLGAARNFGVSQSRGRYVLPVDADNVVEPSFVAWAVDLLEADPDLAYVTAWSRYVDEQGRDLLPNVSGYQPFGNRSDLDDQANVAGDAMAVLPRRIFTLGFRYSEDLTSYEDWQLYRELRAAGRYGTVIPERLFRYRVRGGSMIRETGLPNHERLLGEMTAYRREGEVAWTSRSG